MRGLFALEGSMTRGKGRLDLKADIRSALAPHIHLEPGVDAVLAAVLPHIELAYQRGVMAERSRAGYQKIKENSE
jgi:hypothetical protein